jgi:hypothetical protein
MRDGVIRLQNFGRNWNGPESERNWRDRLAECTASDECSPKAIANSIVAPGLAVQVDYVQVVRGSKPNPFLASSFFFLFLCRYRNSVTPPRLLRN